MATSGSLWKLQLITMVFDALLLPPVARPRPGAGAGVAPPRPPPPPPACANVSVEYTFTLSGNGVALSIHDRVASTLPGTRPPGPNSVGGCVNRRVTSMTIELSAPYD